MKTEAKITRTLGLALLGITAAIATVRTEPWPIVEQLRFTGVPGLNAPAHPQRLIAVNPFPAVDSTIVVVNNNTLCLYNGATFATSNPVQLFTAPFQGGVNLSGAVIRGSGGNDRILLVGGPAGASSHPLSGFTLGPPFERHGEVWQVPGADQFGHQVVLGNLMGDDTLEMAAATNLGGSAFVHLFEPGTNGLRSFTPFGETYTDGFQLTTGDINGNGHDELIVYQTRGREFRAFEFRNLTDPPVLIGYGDPFGPSFFGGGGVDAFDINNDGFDELIFVPGPGRTPLVRVFDFNAPSPLLVTEFLAGPETATGGTSVQAGLSEGDLMLAFIVRDPGPSSAQIERMVTYILDEDNRFIKTYDRHPFGSAGTAGLTVAFIMGMFDK
jgi:hypothetical protein